MLVVLGVVSCFAPFLDQIHRGEHGDGPKVIGETLNRLFRKRAEPRSDNLLLIRGQVHCNLHNYIRVREKEQWVRRVLVSFDHSAVLFLPYLGFNSSLFLAPPFGHCHWVLALNRESRACASESTQSRRHGQFVWLQIMTSHSPERKHGDWSGSLKRDRNGNCHRMVQRMTQSRSSTTWQLLSERRTSRFRRFFPLRNSALGRIDLSTPRAQSEVGAPLTSIALHARGFTFCTVHLRKP